LDLALFRIYPDYKRVGYGKVLIQEDFAFGGYNVGGEESGFFDRQQGMGVVMVPRTNTTMRKEVAAVQLVCLGLWLPLDVEDRLAEW
jgi:hypothetical protein